MAHIEFRVRGLRYQTLIKAAAKPSIYILAIQSQGPYAREFNSGNFPNKDRPQ